MKVVGGGVGGCGGCGSFISFYFKPFMNTKRNNNFSVLGPKMPRT